MSSRVIFLLSILMATITTLLFVNYTQQEETKEVTVEPKTTEVLVASDVINENQVVTDDMVEFVSVPEEDVHPSTLKTLEDIDGKYATAMIDKGEVILAHRLQDKATEKLVVSRKVTEGYRAVSVGVNIVQSVANLIEPEDYVDVFFSEIVEEETENEVITEQLLSNVRVLAIGRKMSNSPEEEYVEYSSVTVELNEADAKRLVNASERGNIHFALHSSIQGAEE